MEIINGYKIKTKLILINLNNGLLIFIFLNQLLH